jgi:hypothetical protein
LTPSSLESIRRMVDQARLFERLPPIDEQETSTEGET